MTLLVAEGITKRFSGITALDDVSLDVDEGEAVGLIGPNGAGKTTFFNCLLGLLRPDAGRVMFRDADITRVPVYRRARLGFARTFQRVELFAGMDRRQSEQIARLLKERRFTKGETVIMEGSGGAAFFIIASGEAKVSSKGVNLATLGPGEHFGEVALIDGGPRSATVTAASDLVCYGLTFWEFRPLVERNGTIGWRLLQALAKQLRDAVSAKEKTP